MTAEHATMYLMLDATPEGAAVINTVCQQLPACSHPAVQALHVNMLGELR